MGDFVGQVLFNRYKIVEFLGRGGMADVYLAHDGRRDIPVALKFLREDLSEDRSFRRRFKREAQVLADLQHPNIVRFYGFETAGDMTFIVMEYIKGQVLRKALLRRKEPLTLGQALGVLEPICRALTYAHKEGVYHCDVKPANIFLEPSGRVVLSDFGIARFAEAATATFSTPGTPAYMAPEQITGAPLDARTDVYALGIMLYELMTLERPFDEDKRGDTSSSRSERIRAAHLHTAPRPPRRINSNIDKHTEAVILKALAKKPEERFQSVEELLTIFNKAGAITAIPVTDWLKDEGDTQAAREQPDRLARLDGLYQTLQKGIQAAENTQNWKKVIERCSEMLSIDPTYRDVANLLVVAKSSLERLQEAADHSYRSGRNTITRGLREVEKARDLHPEHPDPDHLFPILESHRSIFEKKTGTRTSQLIKPGDQKCVRFFRRAWLYLPIPLLLCLVLLTAAWGLDDIGEMYTLKPGTNESGYLGHSDDMYTFYGQQGDVIDFFLVRTLGFEYPKFEISSPSGVIITIKEGAVILPETGNYQIRVFGESFYFYKMSMGLSTRTPAPTSTHTPTRTPTPTPTPTRTPTPTPTALFFAGARNDVDPNNLIGWLLCWSGRYNESEPLKNILSACRGDWLMLACRPVGQQILTVAAMGPRNAVLNNTGDTDNTYSSNQVQWYFSDDYSWGFIETGTVYRDSCDMNNQNDNKRLCWHTGGGEIQGGWRCGSAVWLNDSDNWERLIFQMP